MLLQTGLGAAAEPSSEPMCRAAVEQTASRPVLLVHAPPSVASIERERASNQMADIEREAIHPWWVAGFTGNASPERSAAVGGNDDCTDLIQGTGLAMAGSTALDGHGQGPLAAQSWANRAEAHREALPIH